MYCMFRHYKETCVFLTGCFYLLILIVRINRDYFSKQKLRIALCVEGGPYLLCEKQFVLNLKRVKCLFQYCFCDWVLICTNKNSSAAPFAKQLLKSYVTKGKMKVQ
jgi:hypothetical protein